MSDRLLEQGIDIKFYVALGKNASDTCALFSDANGGETLKKPSVFEGHKRFKLGRDHVERDKRSGRERFHKNRRKF